MPRHCRWYFLFFAHPSFFLGDIWRDRTSGVTNRTWLQRLSIRCIPFILSRVGVRFIQTHLRLSMLIEILLLSQKTATFFVYSKTSIRGEAFNFQQSVVVRVLKRSSIIVGSINSTTTVVVIDIIHTAVSCPSIIHPISCGPDHTER